MIGTVRGRWVGPRSDRPELEPVLGGCLTEDGSGPARDSGCYREEIIGK